MTKICVAPKPGLDELLNELVALSSGAILEINPYPQASCILVQSEDDVDAIRQFILEAGFYIRGYEPNL